MKNKKKSNKKKVEIEIKDDVVWLPIGMCLGISIGMCFGVAIDSIPMGMCFGLCFGMMCGTIMDSNKKNKKK